MITERLNLRMWHDEDLDFLARLNADPEVMRYILDGSTRDRAQSAAGLRRMKQSWEELGYGPYAVEVRATGELIGWAGLAVPDFLPSVMPSVEVGWRLARSAWGRGYATEAATEALRFGFQEAGLKRIISIRHLENERSGRVMEKLGLRFDQETVVPGFGQPVAVYAITRDQWTDTSGPSPERPRR
jgi:RimJ/RimL family protein N-acetyltransferase